MRVQTTFGVLLARFGLSRLTQDTPIGWERVQVSPLHSFPLPSLFEALTSLLSPEQYPRNGLVIEANDVIADINMATPWDRLVIPNIDYLVGVMNPSYFMDKLLAKDLINRPDYMVLKPKTPPEQVRQLFVELLPTKPTKAYEDFRQVLRDTKEQSHLLEKYFPPGTRNRKSSQSSTRYFDLLDRNLTGN